MGRGTSLPPTGPVAIDAKGAAELVQTARARRPSVGSLGPGLRAERDRILANWGVRVASQPTFRAAPEIGLAVVNGAMPALLDETLAAILRGDPARNPVALERAGALAASHGETRQRAGFSLECLLLDYHHLRQEVWSALWRLVDANPALRDAVRSVQPRLETAIDRLSARAAESWLAHRDLALAGPN